MYVSVHYMILVSIYESRKGGQETTKNHVPIHICCPGCTCDYNIMMFIIGFVPVDGSPATVLIPIILPVAITYYVLAFFGIIFALVCLFFNIIFRKRK